jgi:heme A synthase
VHRCAVLLAVGVLVLIATGALLTGMIRPLPGGPPATAPVENPVLLRWIHQGLAGAVAILAISLAILASPGKNRVAAWLAAGFVLMDAVSGMLPPLAGVLHAVLAPLVFSSAAAMVVLTSKDSQSPPVPVEHASTLVVRLAVWVPVLLVVQIALGAGFRHDALGVIWHILNALIAMMAILVLGVSVLRQYPGHPTLRPAALVLLIVTSVQVLLGFAVYVTVILVSEKNMALTVLSAVHVVTGSLTVGASVVLTIQLRTTTTPKIRRGGTIRNTV